MAGNIVLSVGFYPHSSEQMHGESIGITEQDKEKLDELHKRKIDLADEIYVLNVNGYVGSSTRSEIEYAQKLNKPIRYLEN
jgi:cell division protein FtsB